MSLYPMYICKIHTLIEDMQRDLSPTAFSHAMEFMSRESEKILAPVVKREADPSNGLQNQAALE